MSGASFEKHVIAEARLDVLRELARQSDNRMSELLLAHALYALGHNRTRDWIRTQLRYLADLGAVAVTEGDVWIAELRRAGEDHVRRRGPGLEGVAKPAVGE